MVMFGVTVKSTSVRAHVASFPVQISEVYRFSLYNNVKGIPEDAVHCILLNHLFLDEVIQGTTPSSSVSSYIVGCHFIIVHVSGWLW